MVVLINPESLNLQVEKLRPNGKFLVWCYLTKHSEAKAVFDPVSKSYYCFSCKISKTLGQIAKDLQGSVEYKDFKEHKKQNTDWINLFKNPLALDNRYLVKRKILNSTIERFEIKADSKAVYIPFRNFNGELTGLLQRNYFGNLRYIYHGQTPLYYPYNLQYTSDKIYLTEGVFGFFNFWQNELPVYSNLGSYIKQDAISELTNQYVVHACFDDDEAGMRGYSELLKKGNGKVKVLVPGIEADEVTIFPEFKNFTSNRQNFYSS